LGGGVGEFISVYEIGYNRRRLPYFEKAFFGYLELNFNFFPNKKSHSIAKWD